MKRLITAIVLVSAVSLLIPDALAQGDTGKLIEEAKGLFVRKKWSRALRRFKLAQQLGAKGEENLEIALHVGAIYAETGQADLAQKNFGKYLWAHPTAPAPAAFTRKMAGALEEARRAFPIVSGITLGREEFKPYREKMAITFTIEGRKSVLEKTEVTFRAHSEPRGNVVLEAPVTLDTSASSQRILWDGRDNLAIFVKNGNYTFTVQAVREDGWKHESTYRVEVGGNLNSAEIVAFRKKARRIEVLSGKRHVDCIPGKPLVKIGVKPTKRSAKAIGNYIYYIFIGALRDILDFPIKWLLSLPGVGHALTATSPFLAGYSLGNIFWSVDKADYYQNDPMSGLMFDKKSYKNDKQVIEQRSMATGVLGPVWAVAYAGLMSVLSWAGTEDGIAKGFNSYSSSNILLAGGYDPKYFFPNYRSLDFTVIREDTERLAQLEQQVIQTNASIKQEIISTNQAVDRFNEKEMWPFKRAIADELKRKFHNLGVMTVRER